jgi:hypothetical protein
MDGLDELETVLRVEVPGAYRETKRCLYGNAGALIYP